MAVVDRSAKVNHMKGLRRGNASEHCKLTGPSSVNATNCPGISRSPAASSRPCTAAGCGRCGSTPGSAPPPSPTRAIAICSAQGVSGLSVAFDLPTQMGYDSDHPLAAGEVGRVGVAIDSIEDMAELFDGIPLDRRLDVDDDQRDGDHPAGALRRGRAAAGRADRRRCPARSRTTSSRSTSRAAPTSIRRAPSLRIVTDIFAFCERELPNWNTISISGYHIREAGLDRGAGSGVHVRQRDRLRRRRRSTPGSTSTGSASGCRSSSTRTTTSSKRSRSSAPRAGCGRASCATGSARPTRARSSCASTRRRPAAR